MGILIPKESQEASWVTLHTYFPVPQFSCASPERFDQMWDRSLCFLFCIPQDFFYPSIQILTSMIYISFPLLQKIITDTTFKMNFSGNLPTLRRRVSPFSHVPLISHLMLYYDLLLPDYLMWILILETLGLLVFASLLLIAYTSGVFEFMLNSKHLINFIDVITGIWNLLSLNTWSIKD